MQNIQKEEPYEIKYWIMNKSDNIEQMVGEKRWKQRQAGGKEKKTKNN